MFALLSFALGASGCAQLGSLREGAGDLIATPGTGIMPPTAGAITGTSSKLRDLPPPEHPVAVAVYGYGDQTGQMKPNQQGATVANMSRAVTQGATSILIKALQDAGNGRWFTVIERERLDNLLKERRIIADMRTRYLGEQVVNPQALPPLLFAGVLIDGGIIGYDSNTKTGGAGANYFGIGGDATYSEDTVTVYLRGTSVKTGQVLLSVTASKKILSYGLDGNVYRYVTFNRLLQAEIGFTRNEPGSLAVQQAIEQALLQFIVEGSARGLWAFGDKAFQNSVIEEYELGYLAAATKQTNVPPPGGASAGTATAANGQPHAQPATAPVKPATAQVRTAAAAALKPAKPEKKPKPDRAAANRPGAVPLAATQGVPVQWAALKAPPVGAPAPAPTVYPQQNTANAAANTSAQANTQPQPAPPPFVVQPRTLEDEVPISPR
jgi:curli production assembly/transport component CsgG